MKKFQTGSCKGYGTMAMETAAQLEAENCKVPTHVFVQAGVGSLAGRSRLLH